MNSYPTELIGFAAPASDTTDAFIILLSAAVDVMLAVKLAGIGWNAFAKQAAEMKKSQINRYDDIASQKMHTQQMKCLQLTCFTASGILQRNAWHWNTGESTVWVACHVNAKHASSADPSGPRA